MIIHIEDSPEDSKQVLIEIAPGDDVQIRYINADLPTKVRSVMRAIGGRPVEYTRTRADEELCKRLRFATEQ